MPNDPLTPFRSSKSILILSGVKGDTRRYRALHLIEQLRLIGINARFAHLTDSGFEKVLFSHPWDMIVFQRVPFFPYVKKIVGRLGETGTLLVSDFDDLIFDTSMFQYINSPDFADPIRAGMYKKNMEQLREMLDYSHAILASTDFLAERIRMLGKPVWVHRNAFSLKMLSLSEQARQTAEARDSEKVVIGYGSGTPTHNRDFEMIKPALMNILWKYPQVELHLIGPIDPGENWQGLETRIRRTGLVHWSKLPALLTCFDINLAPLVMDNPFSQSKSEIKYMEAAMVGIPTIASPTDAFAYAVRSGENGFLAETPEQWEHALSTLVEDATLRQKIGMTAHEIVNSAYHPAIRAHELIDRLDEINQSCAVKPFWTHEKPGEEIIKSQVQRAAAEGGWAPEKFEKGPSNIQVGLFTLRTRGFLATARSAWIYFRRMISPIFPFKK